ncbi:MAG: DNA photolyase [Gammaproteobacteria bacterium]|nr:DNA photolyase [Gammaproteobacteria bacterium]
MKTDYSEKFSRIVENTLFSNLQLEGQAFIQQIAFAHRFTQQELRQICEIARDLEMWGEEPLARNWAIATDNFPSGQSKKALLEQLRGRWSSMRDSPNHYPAGGRQPVSRVKARISTRSKPKLGLGFCPVASPKTRCCNLLTLDAVDNCGYHCSYCSIQSFFSGDRVYFDPDFPDKLAQLQIDPDRIYHIGTGQSSDSLMWGNSHNVLDALVTFARENPNLILELKTKSGNVSHLLDLDLPANLICTWSLNPQCIIEHEEKGSASLERRMAAALSLQQKGCLVGFHFHPMIHFDGWKVAYTAVTDRLQQLFDPDWVAMISIGTLTYTRQVIRKIRERGGDSQILKMPLVEADGKLSYPDEIKTALFSTLYRSFSADWQSIFFYLCMENQRLWRPVFGFEYASNDQLEQAMKNAYMNKINRVRSENTG